MSVDFICPYCGKKMSSDDVEVSGNSGWCRHCRKTVSTLLETCDISNQQRWNEELAEKEEVRRSRNSAKEMLFQRYERMRAMVKQLQTTYLLNHLPVEVEQAECERAAIIEAEAVEAFNRYCESANGRTYDNKPIPKWELLTDEVRSHWVAVVEPEIPSAQWFIDQIEARNTAKPIEWRNNSFNYRD